MDLKLPPEWFLISQKYINYYVQQHLIYPLLINPFLKNIFIGSGQNFGDATMTPRVLGEIPLTCLPSTFEAGTGKQWYTVTLFDTAYAYINSINIWLSPDKY